MLSRPELLLPTVRASQSNLCRLTRAALHAVLYTFLAFTLGSARHLAGGPFNAGTQIHGA